MRALTIAGRVINDDGECWVIAELGHNHQGSVHTCKELIRQAKAAGADAVKLQKRDNRTLFTKEQFDRPYESEHAFAPTYGAHREALEFDAAQYRELKAYAESLGLVFFATAFDLPSVDFLDALNVPVIKIASFDVRSLGLVQYAAATGRPLIISTGTATDADVYAVVNAAWDGLPLMQKQHDKAGFAIVNHALLHSTSEYPAPAEHLNLAAIGSMRATYFNTVVGFSSHFSGISMPLVAYVLGARIMEVHFTLNRAMKGSDHAFSLEPDGLRKLVRDLRRAKAAMGDGVKRPYAEEMVALAKMNKPLPLVSA